MFPIDMTLLYNSLSLITCSTCEGGLISNSTSPFHLSILSQPSGQLEQHLSLGTGLRYLSSKCVSVSPCPLGFTCVFLKLLVFRLFLTDTPSSLLLFENHLHSQIPAATSKQAANMPPIPAPIESELSLPCLSVDESHLGMINLVPPSHFTTI